jgi:hypothetical protein
VLEGAADEVEAAWAVAHVKVQDAGLAGDDAGDVGVGWRSRRSSSKVG